VPDPPTRLQPLRNQGAKLNFPLQTLGADIPDRHHPCKTRQVSSSKYYPSYLHV